MTVKSFEVFKKISPGSNMPEHKIAVGSTKSHLDFSAFVMGPLGSFSMVESDLERNQTSKLFSLAMTEQRQQIAQNCGQLNVLN